MPGFSMGFTSVGIGEAKLRLLELGKRVPRSAKATLYKLAQAIITDAKQHYVPVAIDGGELRASGAVEPVERETGGISVKLGFGDGPSAPYALAVHEHLSEHSPESWKKAGDIKWNVQGSGPKYLEKPLLTATGGGKMEQNLADGLSEDWAKE